MKKDILILNVTAGFNENQTWITYLPYDYSKIYSHSEKFNGLKIFTLDKFRFRVNKNIRDRLDVKDFLQKCTVEYDILDSGSFNGSYNFKSLTIGSKVIDLQ